MRAVLTEREAATVVRRVLEVEAAIWREAVDAASVALNADLAELERVAASAAVALALVPGLGAHTPTDADLVATLLEYARAGDEVGFRALASMRGVPVEALAALWEGTVARLGRGAGARG
jgi:hypothetical protein